MLDRNTFFVREHAGVLKLTDTYDILDPETQEQIGIAKEKVSGFVKFLRLLIHKNLMPTRIEVHQGKSFDNPANLLFTIRRGVGFFRTKVEIIKGNGEPVGFMRSKAFSIGGAFNVFDASGNQVAKVKGNWKGWTFRFLDMNENELGTVTKKWAGLGKELFTTADNYIIQLHGEPSPGLATVLLAAGLAIDTVFKEK